MDANESVTQAVYTHQLVVPFDRAPILSRAVKTTGRTTSENRREREDVTDVLASYSDKRLLQNVPNDHNSSEL